MLKLIGWMQIFSIVAIVLMAHCPCCDDELDFSNTRRFVQFAQECPGENESHHFCHSINCTCSSLILLSSKIPTIDLAASEINFFIEPPELLSRVSIEIFQPPRTPIA